MTIYEQTQAAIAELCEKAKLREDNIVVVGCSTSEVVGCKIGTNSNPDVAGEIFRALHDYTVRKGLYLAIQCCEHLNRAIITERRAVPFTEPVNVIPQPKAGGSLATKAYLGFGDPVAVEEIKADAGILESNEQECFIKQQMIANANEKYYLCDSSKIDKVGFYKLASLDSIDYFITNGDLDKKYLDRFSEADIKFIKVDNNG